MPHGEYPEADQGKCRSCGFLSKHACAPVNTPSPRFYEMEHSERERPDWMLRHSLTFTGSISTEPMCFRGEISLQEILEKRGPEKLVEAILADRKCESWYPYMPGLSPQEHYEQFMMQKLEADRRAYEDRTEESRRRYEEQMAKAAEADRRSFDTANEARNRALIKASIIVGAIIGVAQLIGAIILSHRESYTDHLLRRLFGE